MVGVDTAIPIETSSVRLIQCFLHQLLDQNVGNMELFKSLAAAYQKMSGPVDLVREELAVWQAFETALSISASSKNMVVLIDGLEGITGGEPVALELVDRLLEIAATIPNATVVILSRPFSRQSTWKAEQFAITTEHTLEDITRMVGRDLESYPPFRDEQEERRQAIVKRIAQSANGSFLWADFAIELLRKEKTLDAFLRTLEKIPKSLGHVMQRLVSTLESNQGGIKSVLSWLIVALRPLSLVEVQLLAGTDARRDILAGITPDGSDEIVRSSGSLLVIDDGVVRFRHNVMRQYLLDMSSQGRILMPLKDAHRDFTSRLLKTARPESRLFDAPTMNLTHSPALSEVFKADSLFEYAARYWVVHFHRSSMYKANSDLALPTEFKKSFPSVVILAVVEGIVWEPSSINPSPIEMHILALKIRREALNDQSLSVLQSIINIALTLQRTSDQEEASGYFYQASLLSQTLLGMSSTITSACATLYLASAGPITGIGRSEAANRKERMLKVLLETSSHQYGRRSEQFIKYQAALSELYMDIREEYLAAAVLDELHDAMVERYGQDSAEADSINKDLLAALERNSMKSDDTMQYARKLFSVAEQTMDETDSRRIAATFRMAEAYETQQDFLKAEELLVKVWGQITEAQRNFQTAELQDMKVGAAMAYIEFLRRRTRDSEATSVLLGLWSECEQIQAPSEDMVGRIKQLEKMLRSAGQLVVALSALTWIWKSYVRSGTQFSNEATSIASSIAQTIQQIQNQPEDSRMSSSTNVPTAGHESRLTMSSSHESVLREVFDLRLQTASNSQIDEATVQLCDSISAHHVHQSQLAEAINIIRRALRLVWPSLASSEKECTLPKRFQHEAWKLAERLAYCLAHEDRLEEALQFHLSMYEASKASENSELMARASQSLIQFYNDTKQIDRAIKIHDELLQHNRNMLGAKHPVTVESLHTLASLCDSANHKMAGNYYQEIVSLLNTKSSTIQPNEFKAAMRLSEMYTQEERWPEVIKICETLLGAVDGDVMQDMMTAQKLRSIQDRYTNALFQGNEANAEILQQAAYRYYETCNRLFPLQSAMLVQAAFELGEAKERSEVHRFEAIPIYEKAVQIATQDPAPNNPDMAEAAAKAKSRLATLYRAAALNPSESPVPIVQSAITMYVEKYKDAESQHGCSDKTTLATLAELVALYHRTGTEQYQLSALHTLQETAIHIISSETSPLRLWESATKLAAIYTNHGYDEQGRRVVETLRRQLIFKYTMKGDVFSLDLSLPHDRRCYVFIATLEEGLLRSESATFSDLMSNLLTETILLEHFTQAEAFDQKLTHAARLRRFLVSNKRYDQVHVLESRVFETFMATLNAPTTPSEQNMREFLIRTIEELEKDDQNSMGSSACVAGDILTKGHIQQEEYVDSYEVAFCAFNFTKSLGAYQNTDNIAYGFRLSLYMAGRGAGGTPTNEVLRDQMRGLSKLILQEMLSTCKQLEIDITQMRLSELKDLAELLNEHESYVELEVRPIDLALVQR